MIVADRENSRLQFFSPEGEYLTVKVQKPFGLRFKLPLIPALDMRVTVRGASTMRIENVTSTPAYATGDNVGTCT